MSALCNRRRFVCTLLLLCFQVILLFTFIYVGKDLDGYPNLNSVQFLSTKDAKRDNSFVYHTVSSKIYLRFSNTRHSYTNFNTSLCFTIGTDLKSMQRINTNWNCECLPGWHGNDCGQPEVIWRALLAYQRPLTIKGPRKFERRIINVVKVDWYTKHLTELMFNELDNVVDLFVLYGNGSNYLQQALNNGYLKQFHNKILYIDVRLEKLFHVLQNVIRNIQSDDLILTTDYNDIPNKLSLIFMKYYDNWPEPVNFRLKWTVYGFFWMHPKRTILRGGASTMGYLNKSLSCDITALNGNMTIGSSKGLKIGDLNHHGGWYCEYCVEESSRIIDILYRTSLGQALILNKSKIDTNYVEELIENGLYIDGKTELLRVPRYSENYFAPNYAITNDWKYDFLLINLYSKLDYY